MRPTKRRKVGLNMRFDRMIEKVNLAHSFRVSPSTTSRRRTRSSGNSSVSSYEVPKTPVDNETSEGRLGRQFSVLKMNKSMDASWAAKKHLQLGQDSDKTVSDVARSSPGKRRNGPLPDWLAETFNTLESEHPLRCLLSPSQAKIKLTSEVVVEESGQEKIFAFSVDRTREARDVSNQVPPPSLQESAALPIFDDDAPLCYSESAILQPVERAPDLLPFSTPGHFAPKRKSINTPPRDGCLTVPAARYFSVTNEAPTATYDAGIFRHSPVFHPPRLEAIHEHEHRPSVPHSLPRSDPRPNNPLTGIKPHAPPLDKGTVNVYTTPGPNFAHSRPVYFDSPTEDSPFSDPIQPDAYELDLDGIDFRWQPFLRSNKGEGNGRLNDPDSQLQFFAPVATRVPSAGEGNKTQITADSRDISTTVEAQEILPTFSAEDPDEVYLEFSPDATRQNGLAPYIGATLPDVQSPPVSKTEVAFAPAPGIFVSPLHDRLDPPRKAKQEVLEQNIPAHSNLRLAGCRNATRTTTPPRQVAKIEPLTPRKNRAAQNREHLLPARKAPSVFAWMAPLKTLEGAKWEDIGLTASPTESHNMIESWNSHHF